MDLVPEPHPQPSASSRVNTAPNIGPNRTNIPPAITAKTISSDFAIPDTVSGLMYIWYWP